MADLTVTALDCRPLPGAVVRRHTAGGAFGVGDLVYIAADGDVEKANAAAVATGNAVGICVAIAGTSALTAAAGDRVDIVLWGPVAGFSSLTPDVEGYVSEAVAGKIADSAAVGVGSLKFIFGYCESAEVFFVQPVRPGTAT